MQDFLATYPGEYHLPEGRLSASLRGFGGQHFFNVFLMVRSSARPHDPREKGRRLLDAAARQEGESQPHDLVPPVFDLPGSSTARCSSSCCSRPGSGCESFRRAGSASPNAVSAALQYVSLDWPTENGWVNYNACGRSRIHGVPRRALAIVTDSA
jgi:hypothetical protein